MPLTQYRGAVACVFALSLAIPCAAQRAPSRGADAAAHELLAAQRSWWEAIAASDTAYLARHSSPRLAVTLSSGAMHDRASLLRFVAGISHPVTTTWARETVHVRTGTIVVTRAEATEADGPRSSVYRYLTVFEPDSTGAWRVVTAQSTRAPIFTTRLQQSVSGDLAAYAGSYRTPRGLALRVAAQDSMLALTEPSGRELRYWPIGPGLFESDYIAPDGAITRLQFSRDSSGRVTALNVLSPGMVNTFPRIP